jgi:hypothetical protein
MAEISSVISRFRESLTRWFFGAFPQCDLVEIADEGTGNNDRHKQHHHGQ